MSASGPGFVSWTCFHNSPHNPVNPITTTDREIDFSRDPFDVANTQYIKCVALFDPDVHTLTLEVQGEPHIDADVAMTPGQPTDAVCVKDGEPAGSTGTDRCTCMSGETCQLDPVRASTIVKLEETNPAFRARVVGGDPDCVDGFVSMDADKTCVVSVGYPALGVQVNGHGRVYSVPPGIDCRKGNVGTCSAEFPFQSGVTLVGEPNPGGRVGGWGTDCSGSAETAHVVVADDRLCTADFAGGIVFGDPGVVELVSLDPGGGDLTWVVGGSSAATGTVDLSADGRTVAFRGHVPGGGDTRTYHARDVVDDATVAVADDGSVGEGVTQVSVSADGRFVAFDSNDPSLPGNGAPLGAGLRRIFVKDLKTGAVQLVSTGEFSEYFGDPDSQFELVNEAGQDPAISANGRYVAFEGRIVRRPPAPALPIAEPFYRVFVRDTCAGAFGCTTDTSIVSVSSEGKLPSTASNSTALRPTISADGRFVAFLSNSRFLAADGQAEGSGPMRVILHDRDADGDQVFDEAPESSASPVQLSTRAISLTQTPSGQPVSAFPERPVLSADGRYLVYENNDDALFAELGSSILRYDSCLGDQSGLCMPSTAAIVGIGSGTNFDRLSENPDVSGDGRFVSMSGFIGLTFGVMVRDTCTGAPPGCNRDTRFVSIDVNGHPAGAQNGRISGDGRVVAFASSQANLLSTGTGTLPDVFLAQTGFAPTSNALPSIAGVQRAPFVLNGAEELATVEGVGFVPGSTVLWNGHSRRTIYLGKTRLQFRTRAEDLQVLEPYSVEVLNPNGRISNSVWVGPTL